MIYYVAGIPYGKDDLAHYGVLGMKWGRRKNPNYKYEGYETRGNKRRATRLENKVKAAKARGSSAAKIQKLEKKRDAFRQYERGHRILDKRSQQYSKEVSAGGNFASQLFSLGHVGSRNYVRNLAALGGKSSYSLSPGAHDRAKRVISAILADSPLLSSIVQNVAAGKLGKEKNK